MADLDDDEELEERTSRPSKSKGDKAKGDKSKPKPGAPHVVFRILLGTAGLLLVIGFFLPWLRLEMPAADLSGMAMIKEITGMQLVFSDEPLIRAMGGDDTQRYLLLFIPAFGLAMTAVGFLGFRWSGVVAALMGLTLVGYGIVMFAVFFFQKTGLGLWLILGGAFLSVSAGVVSFLRSRQSGKSAKKHELALPED